MAKEYTPAPEVRDIAEKLIEILKPELEAFEIRYIFCSENPKSSGRECIGLARKVVGLNAFLAGHQEGFFVMEIGLPAWERLAPEQRLAVVHHELCHFGISDEGNLAIVPHDVEEFTAVAEVFGSWDARLHVFADALRRGNEDSGAREDIKRRILSGE